PAAACWRPARTTGSSSGRPRRPSAGRRRRSRSITSSTASKRAASHRPASRRRGARSLSRWRPMSPRDAARPCSCPGSRGAGVRFRPPASGHVLFPCGGRMTPPAIRTTTAADADRATDTIVLAFAGDPMLRWCWSEPSRYLTAIRPFIRAFAGASFDHGSAWCSDDFVGAALWLPPGVGSDDDALVGLLQATVPATQLDDVFGVVEQMGKYHPREPHWYLPLIGVDPAFQNRGIGSALLALALARCDAEGLPA